MEIEKIRKNSLPQLIIEYLRGMIAEGAIKKGDRLPPERVMAEKFGVSRPSVREALHALDYAGILEIKTGSGTYLKEENLEMAMSMANRAKRFNSLELVEVRKIIEIESIDLAVNRATEEELNRICDAAEKTIQYKGSGKKYVETDLEFHTSIISAAHNKFLSQIHEMSRALEQEPIYYKMNQAPKMMRAADLHKVIAEAMKAHEIVRAKEAMKQHFDLMTETIMSFETEE